MVPAARAGSRVGLVLAVALLALGARRAEAAISVTIGSPPAALVPQSSPLRIAVTVTSTFDVASVEAHVGALTTDLAPATLPSWAGALVVTSLPYPTPAWSTPGPAWSTPAWSTPA